MEKLPTTIEELAVMIHTHMASKEDIANVREEMKGLATKEELKEVKEIQKDMLEELIATHEDVRYLRSSVSILSRTQEEHGSRITKLEKKVGLAN